MTEHFLFFKNDMPLLWTKLKEQLQQKRLQGVGIIYREGSRANADGKIYHFQILWTLPFQFLQDIFLTKQQEAKSKLWGFT